MSRTTTIFIGQTKAPSRKKESNARKLRDVEPGEEFTLQPGDQAICYFLDSNRGLYRYRYMGYGRNLEVIRSLEQVNRHEADLPLRSQDTVWLTGSYIEFSVFLRRHIG